LDNRPKPHRRAISFHINRSGDGSHKVIPPPTAGSKEEASEIALVNGWPGVFGVTNGQVERELRLRLWQEMWLKTNRLEPRFLLERLYHEGNAPMPDSTVFEGRLRTVAAGEASMTFTAVITLFREVDERPIPEPKPLPTSNHAEPTLFCPMDWDQEPEWGPPAISSDIY
jgi:hypothetical protein